VSSASTPPSRRAARPVIAAGAIAALALAVPFAWPAPAPARHHHRLAVSVVHWVTDALVFGNDRTQDAAPGASVPFCDQEPVFAVGVSYAVQGHPRLRQGIAISWTGPGGLHVTFSHHVGDLIRGPLAINVRAENRTADQGLLPGTYQASLSSGEAVISTSTLTLVATGGC
jgi:hypothetical protein